MASYPSGLRDRFAKPLFAGSNPADASLSIISCWVVELVDTTDLKSVGSNAVPVRVRPRVQKKALIEPFFHKLQSDKILNIGGFK